MQRARNALVLTALLALLGLLVAACGTRRGGGGGGGDDDDSADDDDDATGDDDDATEGSDCDTPGETRCAGADFLICTEGAWDLVETCSDPTPMCHDQLGCVACDPGSEYCEGDSVLLCDEDGQGSTVIDECGADETCVGGECWGACETAEAQLSYLGCDFIAVSTVNQWLVPSFSSDFAVVIGNPDDDPAEITIRRGSSIVNETTIPAGATQAITLNYDSTLMTTYTTSTIVTDAAYEISSDVPVAAYQYNPLHFVSPGGFENSYTNDASMLLPEHVLTGSYMVGSYPAWGSTFETSWAPSFVAIAATVDGTEVTLNSTTNTASGTPSAMSPGDSTTFTLNRGDVAQVLSHQPVGAGPSYCSANGWPSSGDYCWALDGDLTGSTVTATAPLAVFSGHGCTFLPFGQFACDHVEEMMLPTETWGTQIVMSALKHPSGSGVSSALYRVVALDDGTNVSFDPAVTALVSLDSGDFAEFTTNEDFVVDATAPIYVYQGMLGSEANGSLTDGDPAMGSGIPQLQVRDRYDFLVPDSYEANYVNIVAPTGTTVVLDTTTVGGWETIGSTGFVVARVLLSVGSHHIESDGGTGFSITTYGFADFTSYLYPGGMNLTR